MTNDLAELIANSPFVAQWSVGSGLTYTDCVVEAQENAMSGVALRWVDLYPIVCPSVLKKDLCVIFERMQR